MRKEPVLEPKGWIETADAFNARKAQFEKEQAERAAAELAQLEKELADKQFKPLQNDKEDLKRVAAYRKAQEDLYKQNTARRTMVLNAKTATKEQAENKHLSALKTARAVTHPVGYYASFTNPKENQPTVWSVEKNKPGRKAKREAHEKAATIKADFDAVQKGEVRTQAPDRISMWQPKRLQEQNTLVSVHVDPVAPVFKR